MRISDIQRGKETIVEIWPSSAEDFGSSVSVLQEVELFTSELESEALLRIGEESWEVEGANVHHQGFLSDALLRGLPRVSWVAARRPKGPGTPATSLLLEVREFPSENIWPEPVDLGVDDKVVELVRKKRKSLDAIADVVVWLTERILISDPGGANRVLLSGSPTPQADKRSGFRLYGKGVAVDIARDDEDRLIVEKVVEAKRAQHNNERRPVLLVRGQFRFVDHTLAGRFRGTARSELDQVVGGAESYLAIWREYNKLERKNIRGRAREFGWLTYHSRRPLADGRWQFNLSDDERMEHCIRFLEDNESVDLEAAVYPPAELTETDTDTDSDDETEERHGRIFAGECVGYDRRRRTVDIRLPGRRIPSGACAYRRRRRPVGAGSGPGWSAPPSADRRRTP